MNSPHVIAGALARAGIDRLPPPSRAYLAQRLTAQIAAGDMHVDRNLGGLRAVSLGCAKRQEHEAVFPNIDAAASALVAVSFRAAPRDWGAMTAGDLAQLARYPFTAERHQRRVAALAGKEGRAELGWWPGFGPTDEAQQTFRALTADWEAFERIGVGTRVLPFLKDDLADWRKFRDEWKNADIPNTEIGGRLLAQTIAARRVREYLKDAKIVDPVLQTPPAKDITVTDAGKDATAVASGGMFTSTGIDEWAKSNPVVNWLTDASQAPEKARRRILATAGIGLGLVALLGALVGRRLSSAAVPELPHHAET